MYSYVGDEVGYYAGNMLEEIESGGTLVYPEGSYPEEGCWMAREDLYAAYDPRCRPWFYRGRAAPKNVVCSSYPSLDGTFTYISLSKAIINLDNQEILGVTAIDLDLQQI